MKSIQTKFICLILSCVLVCSFVIGSAGVLTAKQVLEDDSAEIMNLMCTEKGSEINALLSRIQQSVCTLATYSLDQLDSLAQLKSDPAYMAAYTAKLEEVAVNAADNTEGALAVYVRFNPEFAPPTSGLFWSKTSLNGKFQRLIPTDFSSYSPTDVEHVGWYYIPVKTGKPVWMDPYVNKNIDVQMISYVIPLYRDNEVIGVVGMDIDFSIITEQIRLIKAYQTGYAYLLNQEGIVMYHNQVPMGTALASADSSLIPVVRELEIGTSGNSLFSYTFQKKAKQMSFRSLSNGMRLAITAPKAEIDASKQRLLTQIVVSVLIIVALSVTATVFMTRKLVRPLKELNVAAQKIANGDLSITLTQQSKDEVGTLADSFQQTVSHLQRYIDYINGLAYRDALTGVKNKTAYQDAVQQMEERMRVGRPQFGVVVFDINYLKYTNDHFGHDFGDMLIINACRLISQTFRRSPVFRIGGDEFVVILEGEDLTLYAQLFDDFEDFLHKANLNARNDSKISIARGIAIYNAETDLVFGNVFQRADDAMYENKKAIKAAHNISLENSPKPTPDPSVEL